MSQSKARYLHAAQVMSRFLAEVYRAADFEIPEHFDPKIEAATIINALRLQGKLGTLPKEGK